MGTHRRKQVICAGHICLDITPAVATEEKYDDISEYLSPGSLVPVREAEIHIGGSVGNTGSAMRKLGADVRMMGKVGDDEFGKLITGRIGDGGDCSELITTKGVPTSYSVILAVPGIDRVILHNSGANDTFAMSDIDLDVVKDACLFHFGYPTLMKEFYQNDGRDLVRMFRAVKKLGTATSADMALISEDSAAARADWETIIRKAVRYIDIFAPSAEELAFLIDRPRYYEWKRKADGRDVTTVISEKDIHPLAEKLLGWGAKVILIKCGAAGLYLRTAEKENLRRIGGDLGEYMTEWADIEHFELCYKPRRVVSGTGAGDTCIAAFLCAVLEGCSWMEAVQLAAATGASCVEEYDTLSGIKPFAVLRDKIARGWEKQKI